MAVYGSALLVYRSIESQLVVPATRHSARSSSKRRNPIVSIALRSRDHRLTQSPALHLTDAVCQSSILALVRMLVDDRFTERLTRSDSSSMSSKGSDEAIGR